MSEKEQINPGLSELTEKRKKHLKSMRENNDDSHRSLSEQHSNPGQFIYEILQNAEDSGARTVNFILEKEVLKAKHNGSRVFREEDVEAITTFAHSPKDKANKIGKFGLGFKAVFKITDCPSIHSGKYHFCIKDLIVPEQIDSEQIGKDTLFIMPLKKEGTSEIEEQIKEEFNKFQTKSENLLFLKDIEEIAFSYNGNEYKLWIRRQTLKKKYTGILRTICATTKDESNGERSQSFFIIESNKKIEGTNHKVQIAFAREKKKLVKVENNNIFVFFSTNESSGFSFMVQAPYKTTPSRENIDFTDKENKNITETLGNLVADSLPLIRDLGFLTSDFFQLLPLDKDEHKEPYSTVHNAVIEKLKNGKLLPDLETGHIYAKEALETDKEIPTLIKLSDIEKLRKRKYKWLSHNSHHIPTELLSIEKFTLSNLAEEIDSKFIENKDYKWLDNLLWDLLLLYQIPLL